MNGARPGAHGRRAAFVLRSIVREPLPVAADRMTDDRVRSRGYGGEMMDWLKAEGRAQECSELQLISRVTREHAHRFYFRHGLAIECFEFRVKL